MIRVFNRDGHCSLSPDNNYILYDSYWDSDSCKHVLVRHKKQERDNPGNLLLISELDTDIRCDFHPRWNRDGSGITFDSIHEGQRHIYYMDLSELVSK